MKGRRRAGRILRPYHIRVRRPPEPSIAAGCDVHPAGVKGLGELANVGMAAAVANAVYHATGKRIRDLPIRTEDLLEA
jgi:hypothetical protein